MLKDIGEINVQRNVVIVRTIRVIVEEEIVHMGALMVFGETNVLFHVLIVRKEYAINQQVFAFVAATMGTLESNAKRLVI